MLQLAPGPERLLSVHLCAFSAEGWSLRKRICTFRQSHRKIGFERRHELVALGDWPLRNGKIVGLGTFVLGDEAERIGHIRSLAAPVTTRRF